MKLVGEFGFLFMLVIGLLATVMLVANLSGQNPAIFGPPVALGW